MSDSDATDGKKMSIVWLGPGVTSARGMARIHLPDWTSPLMIERPSGATACSTTAWLVPVGKLMMTVPVSVPGWTLAVCCAGGLAAADFAGRGGEGGRVRTGRQRPRG